MEINNYLPQQIIFKILSLLPLLSLLHCKSVCKSWLSIISDPNFIQTHLNISITKQPSLLNIAFVLAFEDVLKDQTDPVSLVYLHFGEYISSIKLPSQFKDMIHFIGYCNGLVCLGDFDNEGICVWNPSTKRFKMLPTPNIKTTWSPVKLGFGYDSVSDDYKFVRILYSVSHVVEAELYSVNEDCWKVIELPVVVQRAWPFMNLIRVHAINGMLYFVGHHVLVSFDLHDEVFQVLPYPDSVKDKEEFSFFEYEGCVAMIFKMVVGDGSVYSLWTLDDVCGKVGWTKKFNLEPDLEMDRVDLYLGDGQFVALDYHVEFFVYDLVKKETKRLNFPVDNRLIISAVKYTESLVSLNGFEQVE